MRHDDLNPSKVLLTTALAVVVGFLLVAMAGCASTNTKADQALYQAQIEAAQKPTFKIEGYTCMEPPCTIEYNDPRDRRIAMPKRTNGWDFASTVVNVGASLAGQAVVPYAFMELGKAVTDMDRSNIDNSVVDNSTGDYSGSYSGNTGQLYGQDQNGRVNSDDDYTHEPTVVPPPEPVVVEPAVVEQPEPLVVTP